MQHDPMMKVVHPQVASIGLTVVGQLESNNTGCEIFPRVEILHSDADVSQLCYLDHIFPSWRFRLMTNFMHGRGGFDNLVREAADSLPAEDQHQCGVSSTPG